MRLATLPCRMGGCGLTHAARLHCPGCLILGSVAQSWAETRRLVPSAVSASSDLVTPCIPLSLRAGCAGFLPRDPLRPANSSAPPRPFTVACPGARPVVSTVVSPSVFPACVHEKQQKTYADILSCADWMGLHASLNDQGRAWLHSISLEGIVGSAFLRAISMNPRPSVHAAWFRPFTPSPSATSCLPHNLSTRRGRPACGGGWPAAGLLSILLGRTTSRTYGWPAEPELVPLSPYRSPPGGVYLGSVSLSLLHHHVRGRGWGRPLFPQPPA
eukprot:jgi/Mesvir1/25719/Mv26002-RA.1